MKGDSLGDRMKGQYENRARFYLPRRTWTIIRIDGKAFHTYTRGFDKPFDMALIAAFDATSKRLVKEIQGAQFAYTQSDEISILLTDFAGVQTDAWFDGNVQKCVSVAASFATAFFNQFIVEYPPAPTSLPAAFFDARVFTIPDQTEVANYFIWRQQDCVRNSIQMVAQSLFSHRELQGVNTAALQEKMFSERGVNWSKLPLRCKNGGLADRYSVSGAPMFTQERETLMALIPEHGYGEEKDG